MINIGFDSITRRITKDDDRNNDFYNRSSGLSDYDIGDLPRREGCDIHHTHTSNTTNTTITITIHYNHTNILNNH